MTMVACLRRRLWVVATLVVALVAAGCTDGNDSDDPNPTTPVASAVAPLEIEKEPVWPAGMMPPGYYDVRGDSLIDLGDPTEVPGSPELAVVDAATGERRWVVPESGVFPGESRVRLDRAFLPRRAPSVVVKGRDEWTPVVPYVTCPADGAGSGCGGYAAPYGVAGLSAADGHVLWKVPVVPSDATGSVRHFVAAADEKLVVSVVDTSHPVDLETARIVATDVAAKKVVWRSSGMWPSFVAGDTVLGFRSGGWPRPGEREFPTDEVVVALDAATGKEKWDLADRYAASNVYLTLGGVAVVFVREEASWGAVLLDASTGEELADLGDDVLKCVDDSVTLIACMSERDDDTRTITVYDTKTRKSRAEDIPRATSGLDAGWNGYIVLGDRVVDRNLTTVIDDLPKGIVEGMTDEYAVIVNDANGPPAAASERTVHRVRKR